MEERDMDSGKNKLSRRQMLKALGLGVGAISLEACGAGPAATATPAPQPTQAAQAAAPPDVPPTSAPAASAAANAYGGASPAATSASAINASAGKVVQTTQDGQAAYGWYEEWHPSSPVEILLSGPSGDETDPSIRSL